MSNMTLSPLQKKILRSAPCHWNGMGYGVLAPSASRALRRLEQRGFVKRIQKNGRTIYVEVLA